MELLFGAYRRQILSLLLLRPDESFYVREIARMTDVPAGSLHRELKLLTDAGLLSRAEAGNQVRYQVNRDCPIAPELAGIFSQDFRPGGYAARAAGAAGIPDFNGMGVRLDGSGKRAGR